MKCECGCVVVFHGMVPKTHKCYRCGSVLKIDSDQHAKEKQVQSIDVKKPIGFQRTK